LVGSVAWFGLSRGLVCCRLVWSVARSLGGSSTGWSLGLVGRLVWCVAGFGQSLGLVGHLVWLVACLGQSAAAWSVARRQHNMLHAWIGQTQSRLLGRSLGRIRRYSGPSLHQPIASPGHRLTTIGFSASQWQAHRSTTPAIK
jgi:hypothetical protein